MKIKNKERNLKIVELFIEEHKTLNDIGKEFGLTRERIRQIEAKSLERIRLHDGSSKLKGY